MKTRIKKTRVKRSKKSSDTAVAPIPATQPFKLREHQLKAKQAYESGIRRLFLAWHRRAGKDATAAELVADEMRRHPANYWHMFPTHSNARRAFWQGVDPIRGDRFIDRYFPVDERAAMHQQDMLITMENGATWQLLGSDNYERHIGAAPRIVVFSEWALCDPNAWAFIRPILAENGGAAIFTTTFRGRNHAWKLYEAVKNNPLWFADIKTIDDTRREDGTPIITPEQVQEEIKAGMSPALARQEFYCDPLSINEGAYFTKQYEELSSKKLITSSVGFQCAAWHFSRAQIAVVVYAPLIPAILAVHTYEGAEFSTAYDRFRAHHPRPMHHFVREGMEELFAGVRELNYSGIQISKDLAFRQGRAGWLLNNSDLTDRSQMSLTDVLMDYTIENARKEIEPACVASVEALAVAAQHTFVDHLEGSAWGKPPNYSTYDRGVV